MVSIENIEMIKPSYKSNASVAVIMNSVLEGEKLQTGYYHKNLRDRRNFLCGRDLVDLVFIGKVLDTPGNM